MCPGRTTSRGMTIFTVISKYYRHRRLVRAIHVGGATGVSLDEPTGASTSRDGAVSARQCPTAAPRKRAPPAARRSQPPDHARLDRCRFVRAIRGAGGPDSYFPGSPPAPAAPSPLPPRPPYHLRAAAPPP